ncbi:MAG TPA: hypothetical protein DFR83_27630 [Deltaproteobacteria bacterium]|nr:hypothetical protein [Deltaproteobacteria bacterium]
MHAQRKRLKPTGPLVGALLAFALPPSAYAADDDQNAAETAAPDVSSSGDAAPESPPDELRLGGALRFNYLYKTWDPVNQSRGGDLWFEMIRLNTGLQHGRFIAASDYRFYGTYGNFLKSGWMGVQLDEHSTLKVGAVRVPIGVLPYASHCWFLNLGFYAGLEDDHDLGLLYEHNQRGWDLDLAYFHSDEGHYSGRSRDSARYAYDLVRVDAVVDENGAVVQEASQHKEQHTGAVRLQKTFDASVGDTVVGASGQAGGIYDELSQQYGLSWASSAFMQQHLGALELTGQAIRAERQPAGPSSESMGLWMGAFDSPYRVARAFWLLEGNVAYSIPVDRELLSSVQVYNDFGVMLKDVGATTLQNVTGAVLGSEFVYTTIDFAAGQNQPWLGGDWESGLAEGNPDAPWEMRINVNLGLYFGGRIALP